MVINNQEPRRRPAPPRRRQTKGLQSGSRRNLNTPCTTEESTRDVTRTRNDTRRVTFDIRPPGLADRRVHLMFVAVRVMLAVLADVIVITVSSFDLGPDHFGMEVSVNVFDVRHCLCRCRAPVHCSHARLPFLFCCLRT